MVLNFKDNHATQAPSLAPTIELSPRLCDPIQETHIDGLTNDILPYIFLMNASRPDNCLLDRAATTMASSQVCTSVHKMAIGCVELPYDMESDH